MISHFARLLFLGCFLLSCATSLWAQPLPEWFRVYTFDDSFIEMNTAVVTIISKDVSRVRFRWSFDKPESLDGTDSKYQSRLEVMEFNCSLKQYRPYHLTFYDRAGNMVLVQDVPGAWQTVTWGSMMEKLFAPGCELIKKRTQTQAISNDKIRLQRAASYAYAFAQQLEQARDFKPVIQKFFVANYLSGYLHDRQTNWFLNLNPETAALLSRRELQRFYVAQMNAGYLSSLYLISQYSADWVEPVSIKVLPPDILRLIKNHPYTLAYGTREGKYDFLAERIDSVERLRSYTDLLEKLGSLMRKHVRRVAAEHTREYRTMLKEWDLFQPKVRICSRNCLDLPKGTRIFEVNVPMINLQLAEVRGSLRVVSAIHSFR